MNTLELIKCIQQDVKAKRIFKGVFPLLTHRTGKNKTGSESFSDFCQYKRLIKQG